MYARINQSILNLQRSKFENTKEYISLYTDITRLTTTPLNVKAFLEISLDVANTPEWITALLACIYRLTTSPTWSHHLLPKLTTYTTHLLAQLPTPPYTKHAPPPGAPITYPTHLQQSLHCIHNATLHPSTPLSHPFINALMTVCYARTEVVVVKIILNVVLQSNDRALMNCLLRFVRAFQGSESSAVREGARGCLARMGGVLHPGRVRCVDFRGEKVEERVEEVVVRARKTRGVESGEKGVESIEKRVGRVDRVEDVDTSIEKQRFGFAVANVIEAVVEEELEKGIEIEVDVESIEEETSEKVIEKYEDAMEIEVTKSIVIERHSEESSQSDSDYEMPEIIL